MGPPIERRCQVSVEMGPPIERRCQVSNRYYKTQLPKIYKISSCWSRNAVDEGKLSQGWPTKIKKWKWKDSQKVNRWFQMLVVVTAISGRSKLLAILNMFQFHGGFCTTTCVFCSQPAGIAGRLESWPDQWVRFLDHGIQGRMFEGSVRWRAWICHALPILYHVFPVASPVQLAQDVRGRKGSQVRWSWSPSQLCDDHLQGAACTRSVLLYTFVLSTHSGRARGGGHQSKRCWTCQALSKWRLTNVALDWLPLAATQSPFAREQLSWAMPQCLTSSDYIPRLAVPMPTGCLVYVTKCSRKQQQKTRLGKCLSGRLRFRLPCIQ